MSDPLRAQLEQLTVNRFCYDCEGTPAMTAVTEAARLTLDAVEAEASHYMPDRRHGVIDTVHRVRLSLAERTRMTTDEKDAGFDEHECAHDWRHYGTRHFTNVDTIRPSHAVVGVIAWKPSRFCATWRGLAAQQFMLPKGRRAKASPTTRRKRNPSCKGVKYIFPKTMAATLASHVAHPEGESS